MRKGSSNHMYKLIEQYIKIFNSATGNCNCLLALKYLQHCSYNIKDAINNFNYDQYTQESNIDMLYCESRKKSKKKRESDELSINFIENRTNSNQKKMLKSNSYSEMLKYTKLIEVFKPKNSLSQTNNLEDQNLSELSEEVRIFDNEFSYCQKKKVVQSSIDDSFINFEEISQDNIPMNSEAEYIEIRRNCDELTTLESCNAHGCEENIPQLLYSNRQMSPLPNHRYSLKYCQYEAKEDLNLEKIIDDFKAKINDTFDSYDSSLFDEFNT